MGTINIHMRNYIDLVNQYLEEAVDITLTVKNWAPRVRARLKQLYGSTVQSLSTLTDEQVIEMFVNSDPTANKRYVVNWIIPRFVSGGILHLEDLESVRENLELFDRYKSRMPTKDIGQLKTLSELVKMVRDTLGSELVHGQRGPIPPEEVDAVYQESTIVYEDSEYVVVIPYTQRAAGFWGRYCEWCTAWGYKYGMHPERHSHYTSYCGPGQELLIFFDKASQHAGTNKSVQCHYGGGTLDRSQIMDSDDEYITDTARMSALFARIPASGMEIIVKQCLGHYRFANNRLVLKFSNVEEFIHDYGDSGVQWAAEIFIHGDRHFDHTPETRSISDIWHDMPKELAAQLEQYVEDKYPSESEAYTAEDILERHTDDEVHDYIINDDRNAQAYGAEQDCYSHFVKALTDAGARFNDFSSVCMLHTDISLQEVLLDPVLVDEDLAERHRVRLDEPSYGYSGYDTQSFIYGETAHYLKNYFEGRR